MDDNKFFILVVDDTMGETDPFVVNLKINYSDEAEVKYFMDTTTAMSFVDEHMSERMIIFMDCKFGSVWQGIDAVMELREKTSLVFVVFMSSNQVNQLRSEEIIKLINTENIFFIKNSDEDDAEKKIQKIRNAWKARFDCVLERWITRHPEISEKIAFSDTSKAYTWKDILSELRRQTPIGKKMEQMVNQFYMYQQTEGENA
jgi:uncharacterized protein (DUF2235 family)